MLDYDLASVYGVKTGGLNQAVKRNTDRFPDDFMFKLTEKDETSPPAPLHGGEGGAQSGSLTDLELMIEKHPLVEALVETLGLKEE